jgi:hypothetical protein
LIKIEIDIGELRRLKQAGWSNKPADAARPIGTDVDDPDWFFELEHGLLLERVIEASNLILDLSPLAQCYNGDAVRAGVVYYSIQNLSGSTSTVEAEFTKLTLEA